MGSIGSLEDRYVNRHLCVWRRRRLRMRTQGNGGFRQKLAADCRRIIRTSYVVLPLQCAEGVVLRVQAGRALQEESRRGGSSKEKTDTVGVQQWNKGPMHKAAAATVDKKDIRQNRQEDHSAGYRETSGLPARSE
jgi:hypothetical protein